MVRPTGGDLGVVNLLIPRVQSATKDSARCKDNYEIDLQFLSHGLCSITKRDLSH